MDSAEIDALNKLLQDGRESGSLSDPFRIQLIQEGVLAELMQDGSDSAVRVLAESSIEHPIPKISLLAWDFLTILGEHGNQAAQGEICRLFIEHDRAEAGLTALEKGYLPMEDGKRVLFYLLTDQADQVLSSDPNFDLLTDSYRHAGPSLRKRTREAAHRNHIDDWVMMVKAVIDDDAQAWDTLIDELPLIQSEQIRNLAQRSLEDLAKQGHHRALRAIFRLYIEYGYAPARDLAISGKFLPSDPVDRALFLFLTGQWERYEQLDFNQSLISAAFEAGNPALRRRIIASTRRSGRLDWLQTLSGGRRVRWLGDMSDSDWESVISTLLRETKYGDIWRLSQAGPPIYSVRMLGELNQVGWEPDREDERKGFHRLVSLAEKCVGSGIQLSKPKGLKGVFRNLNCMALSSDGKRLACGTAEGSVQIWRLPDLYPYQVIPSPAGQAWTLGFSANAEFLAGGYGDHTIRIWRSEDARLVKTLEGHQGTVRSIAVSPDGRQLGSGSFDGYVKVWRFPYGPELRSFEGHTAEVFRVQVSPDGRFLASGGADSTVRLWSLESGTVIRNWAAHSSTVTALAFTHDNSLLASGGRDNAIHLWALPEGNLMKTIRDHQSLVTDLAIQPYGRILAGASFDGRVSLWSLPEGHPIISFHAHSGSVAGISFFPEGERLVSAGVDGEIRIWDLKPLLYLRLPVERFTPSDIQRIQGILEEDALSAPDRAWLEFSSALFQWRSRYDISLMEPHHIQAGEYDIEIG